MLEDQVLTNKNLERDLSYEIELRKHAEKERDAYMAAYEASIKHFEKFAAKRNKWKYLIYQMNSSYTINIYAHIILSDIKHWY